MLNTATHAVHGVMRRGRDGAWSGGLRCHGDMTDSICRSWEAAGSSDLGGVDFTILFAEVR